MNGISQTSVLLKSLPSTVQELAKKLGVGVGTIRAYLYRLRDREIVVKKDGMWDRA